MLQIVLALLLPFKSLEKVQSEAAVSLLQRALLPQRPVPSIPAKMRLFLVLFFVILCRKNPLIPIWISTAVAVKEKTSKYLPMNAGVSL
jgi:hypothetical protein